MGDMSDYYCESDYYGFDLPPRRRPPPAEDEWACADGRHMKIADMTDSHLFFSLAKGCRGEYGPRSVAQARMPALEAEARVRLAKRAPFDPIGPYARVANLEREVNAATNLIQNLVRVATRFGADSNETLGRLVRKHLKRAGYRSEPE